MLEEIEQNDAKFAYSLILAHYGKKEGLQRKLLSEAYQEDQLGSVYVYGRRLWFGENRKQNIPKAINILTQASTLENQDGNSWDVLDKLWLIAATDKRNPYHKRNASLAGKAKQMKANMDREAKRNSGSPLRQKTDRLIKIQMEASAKLAEALSIAGQQAEYRGKFQSLQAKADPSDQTLKKKSIISAEATNSIVKRLKNNKATLEPGGKKKLDEALVMNRYIIAGFAETNAMYFASAMSSGFPNISDMLNIVPALSRGLETSCRLNVAVVEYAEAKELTLKKGPIKIPPKFKKMEMKMN
jgi:hypothetical protein